MNLSNKQEKIVKLLFFTLMLVVTMLPNFAFAQDATSTFTLDNGPIKTAIDLGLFVVSVWKWLEWINKFSPSDAFIAAITPGFFTFMTFYWNNIVSLVMQQN